MKVVARETHAEIVQGIPKLVDVWYPVFPKAETPDASIVRHYEANEEKNNGKEAKEAASPTGVTEVTAKHCVEHSTATWAFPDPRPG
jgi:hypothetical protein